MSSVSLRHISKVYPGGVTAVSDLNLEIQDKEFIVLTGPSGCGKSTVLRLVAGLEELTEGEVYIGDQLMNRVMPKDRDVAMVLQDFALYPQMTVYENIAFALKLRRTPRDQIGQRVEEAARLLDIEHLLGRRPKALSAGQRQRVALGRAIVREPQVFLMDEPLSNLDARQRAQLRGEIVKLHKRLQTTFLYVTHDQNEAMSMATRIVILKDGVIQQADTPQGCYDHPANKFVAGFIGTPPMNFFDARLTAEEGRVFAEFGGSRIALPPETAEGLTEAGYVDREVILGVRPEALAPASADAPPDAVWDAHVEDVELLGADAHVFLTVPGKQEAVAARMDARVQAEAGGDMRVAVDTAHLHFFDQATEQAILRR